MMLGELIAGLGVNPPTADGWTRARVCDLTEDSRTVLPGSLFVARKGLKADGRAFARAAAAAGAVCVLTDDESLRSMERGPEAVPVAVADDVALASARIAERFYGSPSGALSVIAVTGTNGKTTTTYLVWQLLRALGAKCGLIGTVIVDDGCEVGASSMTTPPAIEMSRTLSVMVESGCRAAAVEASSHALDQRRLDGLRVRVGVFTNLTGDHLDYHRTMDAYTSAKSRLFEMLPADGLAIVNGDDGASERMVRGCRARVSRTMFGATRAGGDGAVRRVEVLSSSIDGMRLRLTGPWGAAESAVPLIGRYNAMNVLQAVEACWGAGEWVLGSRPTAAQISGALGRVSAPPGRLEPVRAPRRGMPRVFVDYAHTDDALRNVLSAVKDVIAGPTKLWVVFGAGGDKDKTKRPRMGRAAAELADRVVITSDNPRSEPPADIVNEILGGVPHGRRGGVDLQVDRETAIRHAVREAADGDVIVIAGKGHETDQVLTGENGQLRRIEFDDRVVAGRALGERAGAAAVV